MPFDRLVLAMDLWAGQHLNSADVLMQVGDSDVEPKHTRHVRQLSPGEFRRACQDADLLVAHAGMGTVLTALELGKPLVVLPRLGSKRETRNDHQVATARWLADRPGIWVAQHEQDLPALLDALMPLPTGTLHRSQSAQPRLIVGLRAFFQKD